MKRKPKVARRKTGELSRQQRFELIATCFAPTRHFADDDDRRAAWNEFRSELLSQQRPGRRPSAWWAYEHPDEMPTSAYEEETPMLYVLGEARQEDIDALAQAAHYFTSTPELCYWSAETWQRVRGTLAAWNGPRMPARGAVGRVERL
jgi:hypothetical protein